MNIDATFWVAVSFLIFIGIIFYFKVPQKVDRSLNESIDKIKQDLDNAEKLKDEAKNVLSEYENKLSKSKKGVEEIAVHTILSGVGSYAKFEGINVIEPEPLENPDNLNPDDLHVIEPLDRSLPESEENPVSIKKVN